LVYRFAAAVAGAGLIAGAALAAATPVTPPQGATVTTSHPVFTWTLPSNEESDGIYIASKPDRTPEGKFFDENVVDAGFFFNNEQQWSPSSPLYAGRYWWLIWSHDRNSFQGYYSAPLDFTIPVSLVVQGVKLHRYLSLHWLDVTVRWRSNVRGLTVKARLLRRGRIIWARTKSETNLIGSPGSTTFTWQRPRRTKQGTPLTLTVGVVVPRSTAGAGLVFVVRAP
jgi:hypothetical protein